jgi:hypothetical protein
VVLVHDVRIAGRVNGDVTVVADVTDTVDLARKPNAGGVGRVFEIIECTVVKLRDVHIADAVRRDRCTVRSVERIAAVQVQRVCSPVSTLVRQVPKITA